MTNKVIFLCSSCGSGSKSLRVYQEFGLFLLGTLSGSAVQARLPQCTSASGIAQAGLRPAPAGPAGPLPFAPAEGHPWRLLLSGPGAGPTFPCFGELTSTWLWILLREPGWGPGWPPVSSP